MIGNKQDALQAYQESLDILERVVLANPTVTAFQSDLAQSHHNIGLLLSETGKPGDALAAYEKALEIQE